MTNATPPLTGDDQETELWKEYAATKSGATRGRLLDHYLPVVRTIAKRIYRARIDDHLSFNDYVHYGH
ncbi:MAG TPA: hypothetical protein VET48_11470, partial [Steroidobacteraceae bacterium]|nr:hypothetical protein [Steroidobacteraceae bacterium]